MLFYTALFVIPACMALLCHSQHLGIQHRIVTRILWLLVLTGYTAVVGLRHEVGADWGNYLIIYSGLEHVSLLEATRHFDPLYSLLGYISKKISDKIYILNLCCALILMIGVVKFSLAQPLPWVAFSIAITPIVIIVGMGYTRQAAALGFVMMALIQLEQRRAFKASILIIFASSFHISACIFMIFPSAQLLRSRLEGIVLLSAMVCIFITYNLQQIHSLMMAYLETELRSDGVYVRAGIAAAAGIVFFLHKRKLGLSRVHQRIWVTLSTISVCAFVTLPLTNNFSTIIDRFLVYLLPLQLYVYPRVISATDCSATKRWLIILILLFFYLFYLLSWLEFSNHSYLWIPYQFAPSLNPY